MTASALTVFIWLLVLKLFGFATMSWLVVFSPLLIPMVFWAFIVIVAICAAILENVTSVRGRKNSKP